MSSWFDMSRTGPATQAGLYLRQFWQPISVAQLEPGNAKPVEILGEKFTLYRSEAGAFHLTDFHCAHRRAQLSVGWVEGDAIRCRYHGWLFGPDGRCLEQPAEGESSFCEKIQLGSHPVREYNGLLFAFLGEGEPPDFVSYPQLEREGPLDCIAYSRSCNYLNNLENNLDSVHVNFVHHFQHHFEAMQVDVRETASGATSFAKMPGEDFIRVAHFVMPNVLLVRLPMEDLVPGGIFPSGYADIALWRVPKDDDHHENFGISRIVLAPADQERYVELMEARRAAAPPPLASLTARILRGDITLEEAEAGLAPEHSAFKPFLEDCVIQEGQGVNRPDLEHLGKTDMGTALIRRLWQRELKAFADKSEMTSWAIPGPLFAENFSDREWDKATGKVAR